ncbi:hypothetical protein BDZ90DRAFT_234853 [Jaminaea rosea]|uniref:Glycosyl transferase CAP10 domain-containing protein n=1 Tax=Jaminaea rosea TaxID=1569628 RepID=A0A316UKW8_9BASI|nr:hypothetical protein BDZ90DRAFT_234853 [Jaminaea rosea]PWN24573.1 hypothetical protein BDZ90DRAFT_234853 [Jaminaea rosea]
MAQHQYTPVSKDDDGQGESHNSNGHSRSRSQISTPLSRTLLRLPPALCSIFLFLCIIFSLTTPSSSPLSPSSRPRPNNNGETPLPRLVQQDLTLPQSTCRREFPLLYPQLDELRRHWKSHNLIRQSQIDSLEAASRKQDRWGWSRLVLHGNRLWLRSHHEGLEFGGRHRQRAMLGLFNQAIQSSPSVDGPLPSVDLLVTTGDRDVIGPDPGLKRGPLWVLAKHRLVHDTAGQWLAPDFGFLGWPEAQLPGHAEVVDTLQRKEEESYPWEKKDDRAFWRGFPNIYPVRRDMMARTRNASHLPVDHPDAWADVFATTFDRPDGLNQNDPEVKPLVPIEEHCRRKYLLHAEGNSYSGRGKFLWTCHSVTIAHKLDWAQHFHAALIDDPKSKKRNWIELQGEGWDGLEETVRALWELDSDPKALTGKGKQSSNYRGWLGAATAKGIFSSRSSQLTAREIADNARDSLRDRYLTPAATACYVRGALRAYGEVMDRATWPADAITQSATAGVGGVGGAAASGRQGISGEAGPRPKAGNGHSPGHDLGTAGAIGDISYESWLLTNGGDWPPPRA